MELNQLPAADLNRLFELGCFFILHELPIGTQFSIDGSTWITGSLFQGLKLIPPGFHIITISPNPNVPSSSNRKPETHHFNGTLSPTPTDESVPTLGIGYQLKKGLIKFFKPQERVIRTYDPVLEDFKPEPQGSAAEETIVSLDYMKSIDPKLAPYPLENYSHWRSLTSFITPEQVLRVIGLDAREDGLLDSVMSNQINLSSHPPPLSLSQPKKTQWGKPRPLDQNLDRQLAPPSHVKDRTTFWPFIDLKRSWPKDAVGPELTKWSRDKSWLFDHVLQLEFKDDPQELLGLLQLSFITFMEIQSIQSFEFYQSLINLVSQSNLAVLLELGNKASNNGTIDSINPPPRNQDRTKRVGGLFYPIIHLKVVRVFKDQLRFLKPNFFSESMEDFQIENWFFKVLDRFRIGVNYTFKFLIDYHRRRSAQERSDGDYSDDDQILELMKLLKEIDWAEVQSTCKRFDWNVKDLKYSTDDLTTNGQAADRTTRDLSNADEDEDEDEEDLSEDEDDEEFQPTVVDHHLPTSL